MDDPAITPPERLAVHAGHEMTDASAVGAGFVCARTAVMMALRILLFDLAVLAVRGRLPSGPIHPMSPLAAAEPTAPAPRLEVDPAPDLARLRPRKRRSGSPATAGSTAARHRAVRRSIGQSNYWPDTGCPSQRPIGQRPHKKEPNAERVAQKSSREKAATFARIFQMTLRRISIVGLLLLLRGRYLRWPQRFASAPYGTPAGKSPTADLLRDVGIEQHLGDPAALGRCVP